MMMRRGDEEPAGGEMGTVDHEGRAAMRHAGIGTRTSQTSQVVW